jgi:hypothetical protein
VSLVGSFGALTGYAWGNVVEQLERGEEPLVQTVLLTVSLLAAPFLIAAAFRIYPQWWIAVLLRVRLSVLRGQTMQHRLPRTPPGEVVGRALDGDRFVRYADRWVDLVNGLAVAAVTAWRRAARWRARCCSP